MISKNELKSLRSLHIKKFREEEKRFIAEGKNSVEEGLKSSYKCSLILYTDSFYSSNQYLFKLAGDKKIRTEKISESEFSRVADSVNPQGILGVFDLPDKKPPDIQKLKSPVIYLDNLSDPGNIGTILRSCDWFGIKTVILSKNSADIFNPKTVRSSAGSLFHLHLYQNQDLEEISGEFKKNDFKIIASDLKGASLFDFRFPSKCILIFSNEANGLSESLLNHIDEKVSIPKTGNAESLNVASAAAVVLSFIKRNT